jgi:hypothetical protein
MLNAHLSKFAHDNEVLLTPTAQWNLQHFPLKHFFVLAISKSWLPMLSSEPIMDCMISAVLDG